MKFLTKLGDGGGDILKKLRTVYEDGALKVTVVISGSLVIRRDKSHSKTTRTREDLFQHIMMKM